MATAQSLDMSQTEKNEVDPITLEIIRNSMLRTCEEMKVVVTRSAYSTVIDLFGAGVKIEAVVDQRVEPSGELTDIVRELGVRILSLHAIRHVVSPSIIYSFANQTEYITSVDSYSSLDKYVILQFLCLFPIMDLYLSALNPTIMITSFMPQ